MWWPQVQSPISEHPKATPTLPSPLWGGGWGWGEDFTLVEILQLSQKDQFKSIELACFEYFDQFLCNSKEPRPQGGALKPKFLKPRTEIPKSLDPEVSRPWSWNEFRMTLLVSGHGSGPGSGWQKKETLTLLSCWTRLSIWLRFFLLLADTPFIPVHRTGVSGAILINPIVALNSAFIIMKPLLMDGWALTQCHSLDHSNGDF